jgi:SRSO17 transposase
MSPGSSAGTAGRTENCQVGVFLAYASVRRHALIDRELYLPKSWTEDRDRCREAGIPDETEFATKPQLAQAMISRAIAAGVPFAWFTADEAYGQAKWLQAWLEEQDVSYVMAIRRSDTFTVPAGEQRADDLIAAVPARAWQKISAGAGRTARASTTGPGSRCVPVGNAAAAAGCWPAAR